MNFTSQKEKDDYIAKVKQRIDLVKQKIEQLRSVGDKGDVTGAAKAFMEYDPNTAMNWILTNEGKKRSSGGITGNKADDNAKKEADRPIYKRIVEKAIELKKRVDAGLSINSPEFNDAYGEIMALNGERHFPNKEDDLQRLIKIGESARRMDLDEKKFDASNKQDKQKATQEAIKTAFDATKATLDKVKSSGTNLNQVFGLMQSGSPTDIKSAVKMLIGSLDNSAVMAQEGEMFANQSLVGQIMSFLNKMSEGNAFTAKDQRDIWGTAVSLGQSVNTFLDRQTTNANKTFNSLTGGESTDAIEYMLDNYRIDVPSGIPMFNDIQGSGAKTNPEFTKQTHSFGGGDGSDVKQVIETPKSKKLDMSKF